jgi:hypothetical protein
MRRTVQSSIALTVFALAVSAIAPAGAATAAVDDARAAAAGINKLSGKRLTLYTDLSGMEIDRLPAIFQQAFPQWCKYFGVKEGDLPAWQMTGFLMKDKARFVDAGLLPSELPPFDHGFSWNGVMWLYEQPSDYYRRHLLLHEGTHGFMNTVLGGCGPTWYMEGMAEYLATHRWHDGRLTLGYMPHNRDEVPQWGRIRLIQDAVAQRRALRLKAVTELVPGKHGENDLYAWCWAAVTLLDRHPRYQERFRQLFRFVEDPKFNERFYRLFEPDWEELCEEWQLFVANLEYGCDVARLAVDFTPGKISPLPLGDGPGVRAVDAVTVAADRGWQNSGLRLEAGVKYRLTASGRYQIAKGDNQVGQTGMSSPGQTGTSALLSPQEPKIWWSEPNGVSIRYYQGRPLGILLAAVRPDQPAKGATSALLRPMVVGLGTTICPAETGTLFLKINDSAGELDDNAGELKVEVRRE